LLQPVLSVAPCERWYIDLTGPHPKSNQGNIYILTCLDSFTKWAEAFPLRTKEAEPIARILAEKVFCRFGAPLSILSDQGKEVDGRIMNEVCRLFDVDMIRTTPYKPSTNQVERFHRTLNSILAKMVADHQRDWDVRLPFTLAVYRATRHSSIGYTPNFLVFGREVRSPADIVYGVERDTNTQGYDLFVDDLRDRMKAAYDQVLEQTRQNARYNKRYYDVKVRPKNFQPAQWVWYLNLSKALRKQQKWISQYEGPYLILLMLSPLVAEIQRNSRTAPKIIHIDKLKPYRGPTPRNWISPEPSLRPRLTPETGPMFTTPLRTPRSSPHLPRRQLEDMPNNESRTTDLSLGRLDEEVESGIEIPSYLHKPVKRWRRILIFRLQTLHRR